VTPELARRIITEQLALHDEKMGILCAAHSEGQWCCVDKMENRGSGRSGPNPLREAIDLLLKESRDRKG